MGPKLKPISEQVIVITGASSGIGLVTAFRAAERGAKVVLASRNEAELERIAAEIKDRGGNATAVKADVSVRSEIEHLAATAIHLYGGIDTWVNNAGLGIFGRLDQVSDDDHRRLFDVNFWGLVNGTQIAAEHLRQRGGAIINLGSVASDIALPLQGMYSASKHAIKGFTDAFRMELELIDAPISVTLIKPASIDTPFPARAKNYLDGEPTLPPPIYAPEDVANAILFAAQHGGRDYYIGGGGKLMSSVNKHLPGMVDKVGPHMAALETSGPPARPREGSLYGVVPEGEMHGHPKHMVRRSLYTEAQTNPVLAAGVVAVAGLASLALLRRSGPRS